MRRRPAPLLLVVPFLAMGCGPGDSDPGAPDASVLLDADRAFAADVAANGADAWAAWFAPDGAMIREGAGEVRGRDAIREAVAYLDQPGLSLSWAPTRADMAASGDLGWTTGTWTFRSSPDAPVEGRGRYVSIWRLQPNGEWKVVMDLGNPVDDEG